MDSRSVALYHHVLDDVSRYLCTKPTPMGVILDNRLPLSSYRDSETASCVALIRSIVKKFAPEESSSDLARKAIASFVESNKICSSWVRPSDALCSIVFAEMQATCFKELPDIDWQTLLETVRSGPGASVRSRGKNSFFEKFFTNGFTTTNPALYSEYRSFMWQRSSWAAAELQRCALSGVVVSIVGGSSLSTVPKNCDTDRTICTEPSLNMMFQLCLGDKLNSCLRRHYGYDEALQPDRNRELARRGSRDGKTATIDLKSASDRISYIMCKDLLPSVWMAAIDDCRSPRTELNGRSLSLHMVSSMGNGFTFPLQTYIFSLAIKCLCKVLDIHWERYDDPRTRFGVFGDDLICPIKLFNPLVKLLSSIGFQVNVDKSFSEGCFRESCGSDWYKGCDIRGVYCRSLKSKADCFSLVNRLNRWSAKHGIPLPSTISYVLPAGWSRFRVPYDEQDTAGVKTYSHKLNSKGCFSYTALKPRIRLVNIMRKGLLKSDFYNPFGIWLAASIGALSSNGISRRQANIVYAPAKLFSPCWDFEVLLKRDGIRRKADWEETLYKNLPFS